MRNDYHPVMNKNAIRIEPAKISDLPAAAGLFNAYRMFYAQPDDLALSTEFIGQRLQHHDSTILLARNDKEVALGFCQIYPSFCSVAAAPILILYDLFVTPAARAHSVGRALLLAAHDYAKRTGAARMELSTAKNNLPAQALYESLDWQKDNQFFTYSLRVQK